MSFGPSKHQVHRRRSISHSHKVRCRNCELVSGMIPNVAGAVERLLLPFSGQQMRHQAPPSSPTSGCGCSVAAYPRRVICDLYDGLVVRTAFGKFSDEIIDWLDLSEVPLLSLNASAYSQKKGNSPGATSANSQKKTYFGLRGSSREPSRGAMALLFKGRAGLPGCKKTLAESTHLTGVRSIDECLSR
jgi:hypothetical protein